MIFAFLQLPRKYRSMKDNRVSRWKFSGNFIQDIKKRINHTLENSLDCFAYNNHERQQEEPKYSIRGHPHTEKETLTAVQHCLELKRQLYDCVGRKRGKQLFEELVRMWDYSLVAAEEDGEQARQIRDALQSLSDVEVTGPWDIRLGDHRMGFWQRIIQSTDVVVVLVSRALFKDRLLCACIPEVLSDSSGKRIIPIYLERVGEYEMPPELRPLFMIQGVKMHHLGLEESVKILLDNNQEPLSERYSCLIRRLRQSLLQVTGNREEYL